MKRFFAILMAVFLLAFGVSALAENREWEFNESRFLLTQYTGTGGDVIVPEQIGSGTVNLIDTGVLSQVSGMTSLTFPETVLHIKDNAGVWNPELTELSLPQSLIIIGHNCFNDCDSLESVTIPAGVRFIGSGAFSDSASLKSIVFEGVCPTFDGEAFAYLAEDAVAYVPDDQLEAYQAAFAHMDSELSILPSGKNAVIVDNNGFIESDFDFDAATGTVTRYRGSAVYLSIPETIGGVPVKAIGENAFKLHYNLAYLTLPEGLESIGAGAFFSSNTLLYVDFPSTLQTIAEDAFSGYKGYGLDLPSVRSIGAGAFSNASIRGVLTLPDGLETIGERAFYSCINLSELELPSTLKTIGSMAFGRNWRLSYVYMDGIIPPVFPLDTFDECSALEDIDLNEHCTKQQMQDMQAQIDEMGLDCTVWRSQNSQVQLVRDDLDIYENGFLTGYSGTQSHIRPWDSVNHVDTIGLADGVFKDSHTIEYFAVPHTEEFTTIGAEAFMNSSLKNVDLFDSVTTIGARAFANCANLEELTVPASVTSIGEGAFDGLTGLKKLTILCDPSLIPDGSFLLNGEPIDAEIRLSADATEEQLAQVNAALYRPWYDPAVRVGEARALVKMPFEPTAAENFDFDAATGTILAYLGDDVDVIIPREIDGVTVTAIGYNAFNACRDYTNTETSSNQTDWVRLRSVVIPETVRSIGDDLFSYCQQLETVVCYAPLETTGGTAFMLYRSLDNVIFVNGVRTIGSYAFDSAGSLNNLYFGKHLDKIDDYAFNFSGISSFVADAEEIGFAFPNCENLTHLCFTEKVKKYSENVASDCPNLSEICFESTDLSGVVEQGLLFKPADKLTVRVPEGIDENNLNKARNCVSWSDKATEVTVLTESESHSAPALPDVAALLPNAKLTEAAESIQEQNAAPEPLPETSAAIPSEYVGAWYGVSMTMDGTTYALADMGMDMTLILQNDGTLERTIGGETETAFCAVENGVVLVDGLPASLEGEYLTIQDSDVLLTLSREKPEAAVQTAPENENAVLEDYLGVWSIQNVTMDGMTLPAETIGMIDETITISGDTCSMLLMGSELTDLPCSMEASRLRFILADTAMYLTLHTDGTLSFEMDDVTLWYQKADVLPEETVSSPTAEPAEMPAAEPVEISAAVGFDSAAYVEKKFVMTDADMNGSNMTAAMLGGYEYSLIFHADGTVSFVMAGASIPGLTWTAGSITTDEGNTEGFIIDYYTNKLEAIPTEKGLDMDYFGSLLMHFVVEE